MTNVHEVKCAAAGRWQQILSSLGGLPLEILDGKHHPCPRCGGKDRFRLIDQEAGALLCNGCFTNGNGDGISALQWLTGKPFPEVMADLARYLGLGNGKPLAGGSGILDAVARAKGVSVADLEAYGAKAIGAAVQIPMFGPDGKQCSSLRLTRSGGKGLYAKGKPAGLFLPGRPPKAGETWAIVEGAKDAAALHGLGFSAVGLPTNRLNKKFAPMFKGVEAVIIPDGDTGGMVGAAATARVLVGVAAAVKIARLPVEIRDSGGADVRDVLREQGAEAVRKAIADARPWSADEGGQPTILVGTDEERVVSEAVAALAHRPDVFQRGGVLVHITRDSEPPRGLARPKGAPRIAVLPRAILRERLAAAATWGRETEEGVEAVHPPAWAVEAVEARGQWPGIRRLEAVVEVPILRADGTVLDSRGYDCETGILWEPQIDFPSVPPRPTRQDAERARDAILETIADFPLVDDTHRAAWLAAVLTPSARFAFHGPAPLFLVDANVRGAGKTRLVDCVGLIASGREMARMVAPTNGEEARKAITALALAGEPLILFDNVVGTFGNGPLDAALTGTTWSDRLLGSSKTVADVPLFATWFATANNAALAADTARRCLWIRLESSEENPEERSGFRHPDLLAWVRQERARLAVAALTILRAYHVAGRPSMGLTPWGSFEAWSDLVRQSVVWAGLPDPGATRRDLATQVDREAATLRLLLDGWQELDPAGRGVTVADALKAVGEYPGDYAGLRSALGELAAGDPSKGFNARSVGMRLHHLRRRVVSRRFLDSRPSRAGAVWFVAGCGTNGTSGTIPSLSGCAGEREIP